jgi:hypothetical protein
MNQKIVNRVVVVGCGIAILCMALGIVMQHWK